jgi:hypothetical protein
MDRRSATLALALVAGCNGNLTNPGDAGAPPDLTGLGTCGPGTTLSNGTCIPSKTPMCQCGPNTTPGDGGTCEVAPSACQATGTLFDPATGTCVTPPDGTMVGSQNFSLVEISVYYDAGNGMFLPIANMNLPNQTPLFNHLGVPLDGKDTQLFYPVGPYATMFTAFGSTWSYNMASNTVSCGRDSTQQLTVGDWKKCMGSASWFKPPAPVNGKNVYKLVVDVTGCVPSSLYSVWTFTSPNGTRADAVTVAPAGGLPNVMITDVNGAGHFVTYEDPSAWFIPGALIPYSGAHSSPATVATGANAAAVTMVAFHSNAQTNPMGDFCFATNPGMPLGINNPCQTPPPGIYNIGRSGLKFHTQLLDEPGTLLTMLKPY